MKLYHTDDDVWHGTQADAKKHAREHNTDYEQRDVPVDKAGLIEYLNQIKEPSPVTATQFIPVPALLDELEAAELRAVAAASKPTTMPNYAQRDWNATDVEDFILNRATTAQVGHIFECLGTRFKELANGAG